MTEALTRPKPRMDHPEELERIIRQIVERVDPVAICLFGSRARGEAGEDSDYDLMIVVPDDFPPDQATPSKAFELIAGHRIPMDATIVRTSRFADRARRIGTLSHEIAQDGFKLHGR
jgi:uncharacterized protein